MNTPSETVYSPTVGCDSSQWEEQDLIKQVKNTWSPLKIRDKHNQNLHMGQVISRLPKSLGHPLIRRDLQIPGKVIAKAETTYSFATLKR